MTAEQIANNPVRLTIEGVDENGHDASRTLTLCRSLPARAAVALETDLIAMGRKGLTSYHILKPQLDAMMAMARDEKNPEDKAVILADREFLLSQMRTGITSGFDNALAKYEYIEKGRQTPDGLCAELCERAKHAGEPVPLAELRLIVTAGNVGRVYASLLEVLGTAADPTAGTSSGAITS